MWSSCRRDRLALTWSMMCARDSPRAFGPLSHLAMDLGGDHHLLVVDAEILQRLTEDRLALAAGIDIGRVDEVDARVEGRADQLVRVLLLELADLAPHVVRPAEGHGAEAKLGNEKAAMAKATILHVIPPLVWRCRAELWAQVLQGARSPATARHGRSQAGAGNGPRPPGNQRFWPPETSIRCPVIHWLPPVRRLAIASPISSG